MCLDTILERLQDLSGLSVSCFLLVHLASPVAAAFASPADCESAASSIQLAARVLYQDSRSRELWFVWVPFGTHILVGIVRRITRINRRRRIRAQLELKARLAETISTSNQTARWTSQPPTTFEWLKGYLPNTYHALSGYIAIPLLLDHIFHHRLAAPPSLRTFQFVSFSLRESPIINSAKYITLVSALAYHSLAGLAQIQSRYLNSSRNGQNNSSSKTLTDPQRSMAIRLTWLGIIGTVGFGIRKLSRHEISPWIARRYR